MDVLGAHEKFLGRGALRLLTEGQKELPWDVMNADHKTFEMLTGGGKVVLTMSGLVGDSGIIWPRRLLWLEGESRHDFVRTESHYKISRVSRNMLRSVRQFTISSAPFCMTTFYGFDNRSLLPPFMPVLKNEDGLFGYILQRCQTEAFFGYLPWVLHHAPAEHRSYSPDDIWKYTGQRTCHLIRGVLEDYEFAKPGLSSDQRMRLLGEYLEGFSAMPDSQFEELVRFKFLRDTSDRIRLLEALLGAYSGEPEYWAADVRSHIESSRRAILDNDGFIPADLRDGRSREQALELTRRLVSKYGKLLYLWPEITSASRELRGQGRGIAQRV
jgi:hypothetical protein